MQFLGFIPTDVPNYWMIINGEKPVENKSQAWSRVGMPHPYKPGTFLGIIYQTKKLTSGDSKSSYKEKFFDTKSESDESSKKRKREPLYVPWIKPESKGLSKKPKPDESSKKRKREPEPQPAGQHDVIVLSDTEPESEPDESSKKRKREPEPQPAGQHNVIVLSDTEDEEDDASFL